MSDKTLGDILKEHRNLSGLTLRQIQEATGISNAYLSQLESNKIKKPSINFIYKLANIYGIDLDDLMVAAGFFDKKLMPTAQWGITPDEEQKLLDYLKFLRSK